MTTDLFLSNLTLWSVQAAVVVLVTVVVTRTLRSAPSIKLAFWQLALFASLALPFPPFQSFGGLFLVIFKRSIFASVVQWSWRSGLASRIAPIPHVFPSASGSAAPYLTAAHWSLEPGQWVMLLLAAGVILRLVLLCAGLVRLRLYRRNAQPYTGDSSWNIEARLLTSHEVTSPVTFGLFRPVILLPASFPDLAEALRETILFHEVLHVRRRDCLFTMAEEVVRSVLWFHPGIWWAVREIQLAREETVDREVFETMHTREVYVDALLAIAGSPLGSEMIAAPLFLRRRHLKRRVISIFSEARMSETKTFSLFLAGCATLALSCSFVTMALPLRLNAAPQVVDGIGISVETGGAQLMHRSPVTYPRYAYLKGIQGTVTAQVKLDGSGNVIDAAITAGPDELRKTVLQSLLNWHFTGDSANATRLVSVIFSMPEGAPAVSKQEQQFKIVSDFLGDEVRTNPAAAARFAASSKPIKDIVVRGLPDAERDALLAKLPVHVGDTMTLGTNAELVKVVHNFDEHLTIVTSGNNGEMTVEIRAPGSFGGGTLGGTLALAAGTISPMANAQAQSITSTPNAVRLGANVAATKAISQVPPEYPPLAQAARVQGDVVFDATIGGDGTVQNLHLISGPPLLVQAAMKAVQQWTYKPTLLNNQPVAVNTTITVNFTLPQ